MRKWHKKLSLHPCFPFNPAKWPFFYGWIILFAGIVGVFMSLPGQTTGISVFTDHLLDAYQIDRVWLMVAYLIGTAASGFLVRFAGRVYDRSGVRPIAIVAAVTLALTLVLLSQLDRMVGGVANLLGQKLYPVLLFVFLTLLFFLLRYSGQGVTTLVARNMVMKWFETHRGIANFFLGFVTTLGFNATPKFFNYLIEQGSWRSAWIWIALFLLIIYVPFLIVFYRDNPQSLGLQPDGRADNSPKKQRHSRFIASKDFTRSEARSTREFWLYTAIISLLGFFFTGFTLNFESVFENQGLTKELAMNLFIYSGIFSFVFQLIGNWLVDYISLRVYLPIASLTTVINILVVPFLSTHLVFQHIFMVSLGINTAFFGIFTAITWPRLFGTRHLGEISGSAIGIVVIASAVGPLVVSLSEKFTGVYDHAFYLCAFLGLLLFLVSFTARDERKLNRS